MEQVYKNIIIKKYLINIINIKYTYQKFLFIEHNLIIIHNPSTFFEKPETLLITLFIKLYYVIIFGRQIASPVSHTCQMQVCMYFWGPFKEEATILSTSIKEKYAVSKLLKRFFSVCDTFYINIRHLTLTPTDNRTFETSNFCI